VVSAPPGSGKTVLLRAWMDEAGLTGRTAWVPVGRDERDPQRFWLSVVEALRETGPGSGLVRALTAAPDLDGWAIVERLLADLAPLRDRLWLVIDDAHELDSAQVQRQLHLLVMRAPAELRFVLATRHDLQLGLHRLRLDGELAEIRGADLKFSLAEARELLSGAGLMLPEAALELLHERTEGWAAGLRLAALSLAGHPDPERFAAGFSGTERTVAEYLLAEVLNRQNEQVRRLLLRTSILDRVNGDLAGLLTGDNNAGRMLQDLEQAGAFVVSLDLARTWFRYHQMFTGMLRLELRRTAPDEITALHRAAAGWFAEHGHAVEAIRHAQAARDWDLAARLLADSWPALHLSGQGAAVHELLTEFPRGFPAADAGLNAVVAADELVRGSAEKAERHLGLAERELASVPDTRREHAQLLLGVVRMLLARQRGDLPTVAEQAQRLQAITETPVRPDSEWGMAGGWGFGQDLRALALISLGITELWASRPADAERHLEQGVALASQIGRPFLEVSGLAYQATAGSLSSLARAAERGMKAVELARRHGWTDEPAAGIAYVILGAASAWQGRLAEAESWVLRAERTLRAEAEPAAGLGMHYTRGVLELARGRDADALAAFRLAKRLAAGLLAPHLLTTAARALLLHTLVRLGELDNAEQDLAELARQDRDCGEIRVAVAALRLAQGDPRAATDVLAPVLDGSIPVFWRTWAAEAFLLEAAARDALGDPDSAAAERALERALDLAEPDGALVVFLLHPMPGLLQRHARHRTAHAGLLAEISSLLTGQAPAPAPRPQPPLEALSQSEIRVLRYLPTNLTAPEIARELSVSPNTVRTHVRHLYAKLGTHNRSESVMHARSLGLLAPSPLGG
jgi:LuxR family transcriptional regulator, maltose regulon positive regulatory protein